MKCGMKFIFCMQISIKVLHGISYILLVYVRTIAEHAIWLRNQVSSFVEWLLGKIYRLSVYIEPSQRIMEDFQILQKELVLGYFYFYFKQKMFLKRNCTISNVKLSFGTNKLPCKLKNVYS